ncbi:MAG TPA: CbtA family protein [Chloroflexota bacterium]|nr:CbtA family protein [Chloroflexota bacterium]
MAEISFGKLLIRAIVAGLIAGAAVATYHFFATEPLIEHAIAIEEGIAPTPHVEVVSRDVQRIGLFVGFLIYGATWSALYAVAIQLLGRLIWTTSATRRALVIALAGYWAVALFPFLKFPANPPGVGEDATIGYRQLLYVATLAVSVTGTVATIVMGSYASKRWNGWIASGAAVLLLAAYSGIAFLVIPASPDPIRLPTLLVSDFRLRSFVGLTLFWGVMAAVFCVLGMRATTRRAASIPQAT